MVNTTAVVYASILLYTGAVAYTCVVVCAVIVVYTCTLVYTGAEVYTCVAVNKCTVVCTAPVAHTYAAGPLFVTFFACIFPERAPAQGSLLVGLPPVLTGRGPANFFCDK